MFAVNLTFTAYNKNDTQTHTKNPENIHTALFLKKSILSKNPKSHKRQSLLMWIDKYQETTELVKYISNIWGGKAFH